MSVCRLHPGGPRPDPQLLARARALPTSILSDSMERVGGVTGVHWTRGGSWPRVSGPALTVQTRPGDNLVIHRALDLAEPGDVLVVDGGGYDGRAVIGEIMVRYAATRGLAAIVVDGAVRDVEGLAESPVAVFARSINHLGPYKDGPGQVHGVVQVGGTVVRSGDVVVGDADGVVVLPASRAQEVVTVGEGRLRDEEEIMVSIADGTIDRSWVLDALHEVPVGQVQP
jgi:regulator of RNase E activity RraA